MNKKSFVISYFCVLLLFLLGVTELICGDKSARASMTENRMLQAFPSFSLETYSDGSFTADFESWMSDTFFARDAAAELSGEIEARFALPEPETAVVTIDQSALFEVNSETPAAEVPEAEAEAVEIIENETPADYSAEPAYLWMINSKGEKEVSERYTPEQISSLADGLNRYRALLPEDGSVSFINVPSSEYYLKISRGSYTGWDSSLDEELQPLADEGVRIFDATEILTPYLDSLNLYPATDHHWHSQTVTLVAAEMLKEQGVLPLCYNDLYYHLASKCGGPAYSAEELAQMAATDNVFKVPESVSPVKSYVLSYLTYRVEGGWMVYWESGYRQFLGGTYGPWRLFETGFNTGRSALVIGDSYENAFIPFIAPYYDTILSTDLRDTKYDAAQAGASVSEYIEEYGISDVYIITCTYSPVGGSMLQECLTRFLED